MEHLWEKLSAYAEGDIYPYHMPGHKRRGFGMLPEALYGIDITEIDGFDDLHRPEALLLELQREASRLYGAEESFYLVNGSTCGILSAVSSALPYGGHILMARGCHRSAYHAAYLRGLSVTYLSPPCIPEYDIFDAIEPRQVRQALEREPGIGAVLLVSPTYEGRLSDIGAIADIVHERGIPLIVDEAHGAHLGLAECLPRNSCQLGADLVVHSVHKTLPALTQTALLHVNGGLADRGRLRRFLRIYQSSSPSYLLMAGIDSALQHVGRLGEEGFRRFRERYGEMLEALAECRCLCVLPFSQGRQDVGKLLISGKRAGLTGKRLYDILLQEYRLQLEMASMSSALAMFTVSDGEEAYRRMTEALLEIDAGLRDGRYGSIEDVPPRGAGVGGGRRNGDAEDVPPRGAGAHRGDAEDGCADGDGIPLAEAWDSPAELVSLAESIGRLAGDFIGLYPPGAPLLVPGERMTEGVLGHIREALGQGLAVHGLERQEGAEGFFLSVLRKRKADVRLKCHADSFGQAGIGAK